MKLSRRYHPIAARAVCKDPGCPLDETGAGLPALAAGHFRDTGHQVEVTTAAKVIFGPQPEPAAA